jgi:hypothetical protein
MQMAPFQIGNQDTVSELHGHTTKPMDLEDGKVTKAGQERPDVPRTVAAALMAAAIISQEGRSPNRKIHTTVRIMASRKMASTMTSSLRKHPSQLTGSPQMQGRILAPPTLGALQQLLAVSLGS